MRITDASLPRRDQIRKREVRYVLMMSIRAVCLILATVLVTIHAPLLALWIPVLIFGMVAIPWLAVILANDGPPKDQYRLSSKFRRRPAPPTSGMPALTRGEEPKIIDADEDEQ
jgi:hypothetical protein